MIERVAGIMEELQFVRKTSAGLPFAIYPLRDEEFCFLTTVRYDEHTKVLSFESKPSGVCSREAKDLAMDLINHMNTTLDIGRFAWHEDKDECCVQCRAAAYVGETPISRELVELVVGGCRGADGRHQGHRATRYAGGSSGVTPPRDR